uniref:SCP domain-containing protein n=1 Tax=Stomoxys calcitrans TaxID=35570 RepID=A0A1I8PPD0_STOCA
MARCTSIALLIYLFAYEVSATTTTYSKFLTFSENPCNYCSTHIACRNTWKFPDSCNLNAEFVTMTPELRNFLMDLHNERRNILAGGNQKGYLPAVRMATMSWNYEFEYLSALNLLQCDLKHDKCRRTPTHPYVGQNLASLTWNTKELSIEEILTLLVDYWYKEHQYITMDHIKYFPRANLPHAIGHFTQMAQERANAVGCAVMRHSSEDLRHVLLACNYSFANFYNVTIYRHGSAASKCQTGVNTKYTNLCSAREKYNTSSLVY